MRSRTENAFRGLYDRHHREVLAYFMRRSDRDGARECTEDVFLVAWRRFEDVPEGEGELRWLYGVARRVLANRRRSMQRRSRLTRRLLGLGVTPSDGPETQVIQRSEEQEVVDALGHLSPTDQEVVRLAYWEELPHADIGEILGCSAGAVDTRLHRAVRRIEKELALAGHRPGERQIVSPGDE
jgi:RNA polymerase sigma-70 factor (ECF subfamily)